MGELAPSVGVAAPDRLLDAIIVDDSGRAVRLGAILGRRPALLILLRHFG